MGVTNEDLLREIDELKGWMIYLMHLRRDEWIRQGEAQGEAPRTNERFLEEMREHQRAWAAKQEQRRNPQTHGLMSQSPEDDDPFPPNVTLFVRP